MQLRHPPESVFSEARVQRTAILQIEAFCGDIRAQSFTDSFQIIKFNEGSRFRTNFYIVTEVVDDLADVLICQLFYYDPRLSPRPVTTATPASNQSVGNRSPLSSRG